MHISTDEVYGDMPPGAFADEEFAAAAEQPVFGFESWLGSAGALLRAHLRIPGVITRSSNNYGPFQFPEKFLPLMITNALDDKPLPIYGDGKQQRDWLHVEDNCRGVLAVLERGRIGEVYNIGGLDIEENLTIARRLLQLMGKPESLLSYVKDRPGHDRRYALQCDKMEERARLETAISLEDGLRQTIDWYKTNYAVDGGRSRRRLSLLLREILRESRFFSACDCARTAQNAAKLVLTVGRALQMHP